MSHSDMFRALIPYNYSLMSGEDREQVFKNFTSDAIIKFADVNSDGLISLYEFYYLLVFIQSTKE
jgi:hypothetical protein